MIIGVIGDIHGCFNTLKKIYGAIKNECEIVYSTGDLIDRGNFTREVIDFCISEDIIPVRGNHEDMLLSLIEGDKYKYYGDSETALSMWKMNGARQTIMSYLKDLKDVNYFLSEFKSSNNYNFIKSFPLKYEFEGVLITHAGIVSGMNEVQWMWNRRMPSDLGKLQIFGHTPQYTIKRYRNYAVNIDTGCVYGRKLSGVVVDTEKGSINNEYSVNVVIKDIVSEKETGEVRHKF